MLGARAARVRARATPAVAHFELCMCSLSRVLSARVEQAYEPNVAHVEYPVFTEVGNLLKLLLKTGGFIENEAGDFVAASDDAIINTFGSSTMKGMFNPLRKTAYFPRTEHHRLAPTEGIFITNPLTSPDSLIYAGAADEIGARAYDEEGKIFPAYVLRELIDAELAKGSIPDWRVRAIAHVEPPMVITFKEVNMKVNKATVGKEILITIKFSFSSRSRTHPGKTFPKDLFESL